MVEEAQETLGSRTKKLRQAKGWTQTYLARRVGVSQQAIANLERDEAKGPRILFAFHEPDRST